MVHNSVFHLPGHAKHVLETSKFERQDVPVSIDRSNIFLLTEMDACVIAIAETLNQHGGPVSNLSRMLSCIERRRLSVKMKAYTAVESFHKWRHFLLGRHFPWVTASFMYGMRQRGRMKNDRIQRW